MSPRKTVVVVVNPDATVPATQTPAEVSQPVETAQTPAISAVLITPEQPVVVEQAPEPAPAPKQTVKDVTLALELTQKQTLDKIADLEALINKGREEAINFKNMVDGLVGKLDALRTVRGNLIALVSADSSVVSQADVDGVELQIMELEDQIKTAKAMPAFKAAIAYYESRSKESARHLESTRVVNAPVAPKFQLPKAQIDDTTLQILDQINGALSGMRGQTFRSVTDKGIVSYRGIANFVWREASAECAKLPKDDKGASAKKREIRSNVLTHEIQKVLGFTLNTLDCIPDGSRDAVKNVLADFMGDILDEVADLSFNEWAKKHPAEAAAAQARNSQREQSRNTGNRRPQNNGGNRVVAERSTPLPTSGRNRQGVERGKSDEEMLAAQFGTMTDEELAENGMVRLPNGNITLR